MKKSDRFPYNPLQMSGRKLKNSYYLDLDRKYINENADTIYVIDYYPKKDKNKHFKGKIWINKSQNTIAKIVLNCEAAALHPFLRIFGLVSIANVDFKITWTFKPIHGQYIFNHVDFEYILNYKSVDPEEKEINMIRTKAILYAYDYVTPFDLPLYNLSEKTQGDYREISALPYNKFFWINHDEYRLNDSFNDSKDFPNDSLWFSNNNIFNHHWRHNNWKKGFFQHPFSFWSPNRIIIKENIPEPKGGSVSPGFISDKYNLAVKFYANRDVYADSVNITTSAVFDPFDSFYHLPIDKFTLCFINIYFDLCEIERRTLSKKLNTIKHDFDLMTKVYDEFLMEMDIKKAKYMKEVDRGLVLYKMQEYNNYVLDNLGIDNFEIFGLLETGDE